MAKLQKNFTTEADDLKAYITCACPACGCGCRDAYDPYSVQAGTESGQVAWTQDQSSYYNR